MTSPLLLQLGIPVLANVLSESLRQVNHPAAKGAADALGTFQDALINGTMTQEQIAEANRHLETMTELETAHIEYIVNQINKTLRSEISSEDGYVRRMRPTFGYFMAVTWAAQMLALAYIMVFKTHEAGLVLEAVESLSVIWTVGLSVLGIYVYKRSEDKKHSPLSAFRSLYQWRGSKQSNETLVDKPNSQVPQSNEAAVKSDSFNS